MLWCTPGSDLRCSCVAGIPCIPAGMGCRGPCWQLWLGLARKVIAEQEGSLEHPWSLSNSNRKKKSGLLQPVTSLQQHPSRNLKPLVPCALWWLLLVCCGEEQGALFGL